MSIKFNLGGEIIDCSPHVNHNGTIKTPLSVWAKNDGVVRKVWEKPYNIITAEVESGVCYYISSRRRGARITVNLTDTRIPTTDTGQIIISCDNDDIIGYPFLNGSEDDVEWVQNSLSVERTASLTFLIGKASVTSGIQESAYTGWEYKKFTFYVGNETEKLTVQTTNTYQSGAWSPAP